MPQRVNDVHVKQIICTELNTDPFIRAANTIVDNNLLGLGIPAGTLQEIERYLAAHAVCLADPRALQELQDGTRVPVQRIQGGKGLHATGYGEMALILDPTGMLDLVTSTRRAYIKVD